MRPFWEVVRNLYRYSPMKKLLNMAYWGYVITLGKHRPLYVPPNIKHGIFYICVKANGDENSILKIPSLHTRYSWQFYRKLRNAAAFAEYRNALLSKASDPIWARHFPTVTEVTRDGGYRSSYVEGYNLLEIRHAAGQDRHLPREVRPAEVVLAIDELLEDLKIFAAQKGPLCGDWVLQNLIYDCRARNILNVDLEGLYTYHDPDFEANIENIERVFDHLKSILQMRESEAPEDTRILKTMRVVGYATEADLPYSGTIYPMGYHSLTLRGRYFWGQRECSQRLADVPYDFAQKVVLDLGCNCGGMLHALANTILAGVGVDCDPRCVNAANTIKWLNGTPNLNFFTLDLDREPIRMIDDFLLDKRADICFLLSVCMWLKDWKRVIAYAAKTSETLLFEANGDDEMQSEQEAFLRLCFMKIELINSESTDDPKQNRRVLYLAQGASAPMANTLDTYITTVQDEPASLRPMVRAEKKPARREAQCDGIWSTQHNSASDWLRTSRRLRTTRRLHHRNSFPHYPRCTNQRSRRTKTRP